MEGDCFQTIDEDAHQHIQEKDQSEDIGTSIPEKLGILPNPILPRDKTADEHKPVRWRFAIDQRFRSRNHFRQVSLLPRIETVNFQSVLNRSGDTSLQQHQPSQSTIKQQDRDYGEFTVVLKECRLVFKRVDNSNFNSFARNGRRYYCSIFIDKTFIIDNLERNANHPLLPINLIDLIGRVSPQQQLSQLVSPEPQIQFDSSFESGNLFAAFRRSQRHYELLMMNDTNTKGSTQWFYFQMKNQKRCKIRLSILNFYKERSLYEQGMRVLAYSHEQQRRDSQQWQRTGENFEYKEDWGLPQCNRLSFTFEFQHANDRVFIAYSFPYTLQELGHFIDKLTTTYPKLVRREELCRTPLNHSVELLTIGSQSKAQSKNREIIYVIARQHAGESPPSFVLEGFINALLSNRLEAQQLRRQFIFKIVPIVNVDGVTIGNYRTNLSGNDLNRKWDTPSKQLHPEIFYIKQRMQQDRKQIRMFLDLHAHSRKMNSFFYGGQSDDGQLHLFPFICSKLNRYISKDECSYGIDPGKKSTARAIVQNEMGVRKSYTFEVSFFGYTDNQGKPAGHFDRAMLRQLGSAILNGVFYSEVKIRSREQLAELRMIMSGHPNPDSTAFWPTKKHDEIGSVSKRYASKPPATDRIDSRSLLPPATTNIKQTANKHAERIEELSDQLYQKWLKEKQRLRATNQKEEGSSGSDSDPEHFLLNVAESEELDKLKYEDLQAVQQQHQKQVDDNTISQPVNTAQKRMMLYSTVQRRSRKKHQSQSENYAYNIKGSRRDKTEDATYSNLQNKEVARAYLDESRQISDSNKSPKKFRYDRERIEDLQSELQVEALQPKLKSFHGSLEDQQPIHRRRDNPQLVSGDARIVYQYNVLELKKTMKFLLNIDHKQRSQLQNCFEFASKNGPIHNELTYIPLSTVNKRSNSLIRGRKNKQSDCYIRKL